MVYDVTNEKTFEDIDSFWVNEVESYAERNVELMLIGNKNDLDGKTVPTETSSEYTSKKNMILYEVSSKTGN